jgi:hypothetical protein
VPTYGLACAWPSHPTPAGHSLYGNAVLAAPDLLPLLLPLLLLLPPLLLSTIAVMAAASAIVMRKCAAHQSVTLHHQGHCQPVSAEIYWGHGPCRWQHKRRERHSSFQLLVVVADRLHVLPVMAYPQAIKWMP